MEVRYTNTFRDLIGFNLYHLPRTGVMQIVFIAAIVLHAWSFGPSVRKLDDSLPMKVSVFLTSLLLVLGALVVIQFLLVLLTYLPSKNKGLLTEHVVRISDDGIVEETAFGTTTSTWSAVPKVGQTRRRIFLYTQQHAAHIIPKRAFPTPDAATQFVEFAQARIGGKRVA